VCAAALASMLLPILAASCFTWQVHMSHFARPETDWLSEFADEDRAATDELVLRDPPRVLPLEPEETAPRTPTRDRHAVFVPMVVLAAVAAAIGLLPSAVRLGDLPVVGRPALAELAPPSIPSAPASPPVAETPPADTSNPGPTAKEPGLRAPKQMLETQDVQLRSIPTSPSTPHEIETAAVQDVLERYRAAFGTLSTAGIDDFWPTADTPALARTFDQLRSLRLDFRSCGVELSAGGRATARCTGRATFLPKGVGQSERVESRAWSFGLSRADGRWIIVSVESRRV
jgi:hypothetical protein